MLKKLLAAVLLLPVLCCIVYADVMYLNEADSEKDAMYRMTVDSSGNFQSTFMHKNNSEKFDSNMRILNVSGRKLLVVFNAKKVENEDGSYTVTSDTTISVYETSNLSTPIASKKFTEAEISYHSLSGAAVWGNHLLISAAPKL